MSKPAPSEEPGEPAPRVAAAVIGETIHVAVQHLVGGHHEDEVALALGEDATKARERLRVVGDVLEHVEAGDGIDAAARHPPRESGIGDVGLHRLHPGKPSPDVVEAGLGEIGRDHPPPLETRKVDAGARAHVEHGAAEPALELGEHPAVVLRDLEHGGGHRVRARPRRREGSGVAHGRLRELAMRSASRPKQKNTPLKSTKRTPGSQKPRPPPVRSPPRMSPAPMSMVAPDSRTNSLIGL